MVLSKLTDLNESPFTLSSVLGSVGYFVNFAESRGRLDYSQGFCFYILLFFAQSIEASRHDHAMLWAATINIGSTCKRTSPGQSSKH